MSNLAAAHTVPGASIAIGEDIAALVMDGSAEVLREVLVGRVAIATPHTLTAHPLADAEAATIAAPLATPWAAGQPVTVGQVVTYDTALYAVLQAHTTKADWTPPTVPALFKRVHDPASGPQPWVQPQGAHDAYALGDRVTHNGQTWESTVANNVWEPGVFGWVVVP